ncbi:hypothetical protein [Limosilactobacillus pontis]|uniref:Uncharacterized protein n=1 Tax=Limosilactobacillus pontis TaxID=35787 RepID=A0ABU7STV0_9LACO
MIKIMLKGNDQAGMLANMSFDDVKEFLDYGTNPGEWLTLGAFIVPVDQIRYIVDMGGQ